MSAHIKQHLNSCMCWLVVVFHGVHVLADGDTNAALNALLREVDLYTPLGVVRQAHGNEIQFMSLPSRLATDENLDLLSRGVAIQSIELCYSRSNALPSGRGVQSLSSWGSLTSLTLKCSGVLPAELSGSLGLLRGIERLQLVGTSFGESHYYEQLRGNGRLRTLVVSFPPQFTRRDIAAIGSVKQLTFVQLIIPDLAYDIDAFYPLLENPVLTNLVIQARSLHVTVLRRPPR